jgi:uncharacterized integral membrane protein
MTEQQEPTRSTNMNIAPLIAVGVLLLASLAFVLQNSEKAKITWLFFDGQAAVWIVIVVSAVVGAVIERLITHAIRRRRRHEHL